MAAVGVQPRDVFRAPLQKSKRLDGIVWEQVPQQFNPLTAPQAPLSFCLLCDVA